jgi:methyl coenzyme M reductase gamma subunit
LYVYLNGERKEEFLGSLNYEALEKLIQDALKKYTKQRSAEEQKQIAKSADDKAAVGEPVPSKEPPAALTAINPDGKVIALDKESFKQVRSLVMSTS